MNTSKQLMECLILCPTKTCLQPENTGYRYLKTNSKPHEPYSIRFLPGWCEEHIPVDAYPYPNPFPDDPKVQAIHNDGFSSGENSWMSMSNASFLSMDLNNVADDDYFSNTTIANRTFTYAEIVLP
jgi:hypothetical protein